MFRNQPTKGKGNKKVNKKHNMTHDELDSTIKKLMTEFNANRTKIQEARKVEDWDIVDALNERQREINDELNAIYNITIQEDVNNEN